MVCPAQLTLESGPVAPSATSAFPQAVLLLLHEETSIPFMLQEHSSSEI